MKATHLHKLPRALVLHINRARWAPKRGVVKKEKVQDHVDFPLYFSSSHLGQFLSEEGRAAYTSSNAAASDSGSDRYSSGAGAGASSSSSSNSASSSSECGVERRFRLCAVVVHKGRGIDTGHYYTFARQQAAAPAIADGSDGSSGISEGAGSSNGNNSSSSSSDDSDGGWLLYDDTSVKPVPVEAVLSCQAYLLFYERY